MTRYPEEQICMHEVAKPFVRFAIQPDEDNMSKFTLKSRALAGTALALTIASAFSAPAHAQITGLYAGGATFPEKAYRDIMNCYGNTSGGELTAGLNAPPATCNAATAYRSNVEILYVGVGSGNGLDAFVGHNPSQYTKGTTTPDKPPVVGTTDLGSFYGTGVGSGWTASATGTNYPKVSFTGSDDPMTDARLHTYLTNGSTGGNAWGGLIQVPTMVGAVAVPYRPTPGTWNEHGKKPAGGLNSGLVDLSTNTLCGIYTGAITNWNDPAITADNQGQQLGSGTIHPLYRTQGSGTTFLFANALINQCSHTAHPVPASWQTGGGNASGVSNNNWFLNLANAAILPANFVGVSGSGGMKAATGNGSATQSPIDGAIGYVSTDFVLPVDSNGPKAANIQTFYTLLNGLAPVFKSPNFKAANLIMSTLKAPLSTASSCPTSAPNVYNDANPGGTSPFKSPDGVCSHNPLNWGLTNPAPTGTGAYPIGGFTFADIYTCYASASDVDAIRSTTAGSLGFWRWYFGSATENLGKPKAALNANGFAAVPGSWVSAAKKLISTDAKTKISTPGTTKTGCAGLAGAGA